MNESPYFPLLPEPSHVNLGAGVWESSLVRYRPGRHYTNRTIRNTFGVRPMIASIPFLSVLSVCVANTFQLGLFSLELSELLEQMVQPQNFFFFITLMVVLRGTAAPVLLKWFVGRDVPTGVPSSNGTIIPIPTSPLPSLVYLHPRVFRNNNGRGAQLMIYGAKSGVLVGASRPIPLPNRSIGISSGTRAKASFCFVLSLHLLLLGFMGDLSYPESFRGVLRLLFLCTLLLPYSNGHGRRLALGLEARSLAIHNIRAPHHPFIYKVVPFYRIRDYREAPMNMNLSHGGVCIFVIGVISSGARKIQFTQRLPLGSELHMGKERCCLRGPDSSHGPTFHSSCGNSMIYKPFSLGSLSSVYKALRSSTNSFMFEHDESLRAGIDTLLPMHFSPYDDGKLDHFLHCERSWWMDNRGRNSFWFTMFPEKRYFFSTRETTSTTEAAIHTNPLTDPYALIGTGSFETGGWYTTMMKLPLIFRIRIGFLLAPLGGSRSLLRQLQKDELHRNRIPVGS